MVLDDFTMTPALFASYLFYGLCWNIPCKPVSLVVAQSQDRRINPETVTETSMLMGQGFYTKGTGGRTTVCCRQDMAPVFAAQGRRVPFTGETEVRKACQ